MQRANCVGEKMSPEHFVESNSMFGPPPELNESQRRTIYAFVGSAQSGSVDGVPVIVTAWRPKPYELERINAGLPIFLTFCGDVLPPHFPSTSFKEATHPA